MHLFSRSGWAHKHAGDSLTDTQGIPQLPCVYACGEPNRGDIGREESAKVQTGGHMTQMQWDALKKGICNECGREGERLYRLIGLQPGSDLWCAGCLMGLGLEPIAKPCGHLVTSNCGAFGCPNGDIAGAA